MAIDSDFWLGRRVLVTGHTGFKGAWLTLWLRMLGAEVCGLAPSAPTRPSLYELRQYVSALYQSAVPACVYQLFGSHRTIHAK